MALSEEARTNNKMLISEANKLLTYLNEHVFRPQGVPIIPLDGTVTASKDILLDHDLPHTNDKKKLEELINLNLLSKEKQEALQKIREAGQDPLAKLFSHFSEKGVAHYKLDIGDPMVAAKAMANLALLIKHAAVRNNKKETELFSVGDVKFLGITAFYIAEKILSQGIENITRESLRKSLTPYATDNGEEAIGIFKAFSDFILVVDDPNYEKNASSPEKHTGIYALIPTTVTIFKKEVRNRVRRENILAIGLDAPHFRPILDELFHTLEAAKPQAAVDPEPTTADAAEASPPQTPPTIEPVQADDLNEKIKELIAARARYQKLQEVVGELREQKTVLKDVIDGDVRKQGLLQQQIRADQEEVASPGTILQKTKVRLAKQIEVNSTNLGELQKQDEKSRKKMSKLENNIQEIDAELLRLKQEIDQKSERLATKIEAWHHAVKESLEGSGGLTSQFPYQQYLLGLQGLERALPAAQGEAFIREAEELVAAYKILHTLTSESKATSVAAIEPSVSYLKIEKPVMLDDRYTNACAYLDEYLVKRKDSKQYVFFRSEDTVRENAVSELKNALMMSDQPHLELILLKTILAYKPRRFGGYEQSLQFHAIKIAHDLGLENVIKAVSPEVMLRFNSVAEAKHIEVKGLRR